MPKAKTAKSKKWVISAIFLACAPLVVSLLVSAAVVIYTVRPPIPFSESQTRTLPEGPYGTGSKTAEEVPSGAYNPTPITNESFAVEASAPEVAAPRTFHIEGNLVAVANDVNSTNLLIQGPRICLPKSADTGSTNIFWLSYEKVELEHLSAIKLPSEAPSGWNGTAALPSSGATGCPTGSSENQQLLSSNLSNLDNWKGQLQKVRALHIDKDGTIFIGEGIDSFNFFSFRLQQSFRGTLGQNRLIVATPNDASDPEKGYEISHARLFNASSYGSIKDIAVDSRGNIYVSSQNGNDTYILSYQRQDDGSLNPLNGSSPLILRNTINVSITFGEAEQSNNNLYATINEPILNSTSQSTEIRQYSTTASGSLTLVAGLDRATNWLDTNCSLPEKVRTINPITLEVEYRVSPPGSFSTLAGIAVDKFSNIHVVDGITGNCSTIISLTSASGQYLPSSVLGNRPRYYKSDGTPREDRNLNVLRTTAIDRELNFAHFSFIGQGSESTLLSPLVIDNDANVFYTIGQQGIRIVPTGIAQLREGWNQINWGGSDDPDGNGAISAITTPEQLADYLGGDVSKMQAWDAQTQSWASWPNGGLNSLENVNHLFVKMETGGQFIPYIIQDSTPTEINLSSGWNLVTFRGDPGKDLYSETWGNLPYASCLAKAVNASGARLIAVYWWNPISSKWDRGYFPTTPDFEPEGFNTVKAPTSTNQLGGDSDTTGMSFDDSILIALDSTSPINLSWESTWAHSCGEVG